MPKDSKKSQTRHPHGSKADRTYDAIVVGGGHNGLTNGAYLAKAGLRTLILERRHLVGGAAITEELRPGFWFTTFSYALSLLRPDIVQDLDLVKHGFMPILMPTTFCPMENGDYLLLGQDHAENQKEIARHSPHDADAYDAFNHDVNKVLQAIKPLLDQAPPDIFSDDPEELDRAGRPRQPLQAARQEGPPRRGPAADRQRRRLPRRLLRVRHPQGLPRVDLDHRHEGRAVFAGLGARAAVSTSSASTTASSGRGRSTRAATAGSPRCSPGRPSRSGPRSGSSRRSTTSSPRTAGRPASRSTDGTEFHAPIVVSALDPRRTFLELVEPRELPTDLVENIERFRFQGTSAKVNFALDGAAALPGARRPDRPVPRVHQHRAVDGVPRARLRRREVRLVFASGRTSTAPSSRWSTRTWRRPASRSCAASSSTRRTTCAGATGTPRGRASGDTVQATLESFFPGFGDLVLQREIRTPLDIERTVGLSEGNIFAGEFLAPQMYFFRPAPGWSQYATPIDGYYQCGSGTHPGGCVMGAPGKLAAQQILKDRAKGGGARLEPENRFRRSTRRHTLSSTTIMACRSRGDRGPARPRRASEARRS